MPGLAVAPSYPQASCQVSPGLGHQLALAVSCPQPGTEGTVPSVPQPRGRNFASFCPCPSRFPWHISAEYFHPGPTNTFTFGGSHLQGELQFM